MIGFDNSKNKDQAKNPTLLKAKHSNTSDSPTASFLSPERKELFPIDRDNRNEQR